MASSIMHWLWGQRVKVRGRIRVRVRKGERRGFACQYDRLSDANIHTHTAILWLSGFCPGQPGWAGTRRNIHPLRPNMVINHPLSASSIYYDPWHPPYSIYVLDSLFPQSLSKFSLVYLLAWHPPLHTPYISSTNHYLLFTTHAHTIATCFAVVARFCHLILVSLNRFLGTLSSSLMPHIHRTILISACWSATSFSFLTGQVLLPCNILLHTQLLYNLPLTINDISLLASNGTNCLNLFYPIRILVSTATSASPSTLNMSPK